MSLPEDCSYSNGIPLFSPTRSSSSCSHGLPRPDYVEFLLQNQWKILVVQSLRRVGKTFSLAWAVLEARRQAQMRGAPLSFFYHSALPIRLFPEDFECVVAVLSFLGVPAIFDEFQSTSLSTCGSINISMNFKLMLESDYFPHYKDSTPFQVLLYGSHQQAVSNLQLSCLFGLQHLGVSNLLHLPPPNISILASFLRHHQPQLDISSSDFSQILLRRISVYGWDLSSHASNKPLDQALKNLSNQPVKEFTGLMGNHEDTLLRLLESGSASNCKRQYVEDLARFGIIQQRPGIKAKEYDVTEPR